jgi:hypothetical protein
MGTPTWLQLSLVIFIGLAAAMVLPPVRSSVPRWIEAFIWLGLIASGWLTATNVQGGGARFLTDSMTWGAGQMVNASIEILTTNLEGWLAINRYGIADALVVISVLDIFSLAMLESQRQAKKALPQVRLGEWFEFAPVEPALASTSNPYALSEWSLPAEHANVAAQAGLASWLVKLMGWGRYGVAIQSRARQARAVAGGHPVDIRTLATAEPVDPYLQSGQSSAVGHSLSESQTEDASTRLAS